MKINNLNFSKVWDNELGGTIVNTCLVLCFFVFVLF